MKQNLLNCLQEFPTENAGKAIGIQMENMYRKLSKEIPHLRTVKRGYGKYTIPTSVVISLEEACFLETIAKDGLGWDVRIIFQSEDNVDEIDNDL